MIELSIALVAVAGIGWDAWRRKLAADAKRNLSVRDKVELQADMDESRERRIALDLRVTELSDDVSDRLETLRKTLIADQDAALQAVVKRLAEDFKKRVDADSARVTAIEAQMKGQTTQVAGQLAQMRSPGFGRGA